MKRVLDLVLLVALTVVLGCTSSAPNSTSGTNLPGDSPDKITICLLPKIKGIAYFSSCADGAREAAEELGNINLIYDGPTDGDARKQAEMIESWMVDGVDAICVSPNAPGVAPDYLCSARLG